MNREVDKLVSIVLPCYNNEAFVKEAIDSALQQSYDRIEVIAIDDGSQDRSLQIIRSFGDKVRWETIANQGAPTARNRGVELARGEYIKFLDADDLLLHDCLERQVQQSSNLGVEQKAIVYGDAMRIDRVGNPLPSYPLQSRQPASDSIAHILACCPLTSCPLHRKDYLQAIGGFDPQLTRGQEHDLHLRLVLSGVEFVRDPHPVYQYREYTDPDRISNHAYTRKGAMVHYLAIEKHIQLIEQQTDRPLTPQVRSILAQRLWRYGRGVLREGGVSEAARYFDTARALDEKNCITGQSPYPMFVRLFGPQRAELLFSQVKRLVSPLAQ
jgi:glycosyltransferase involved in cell wall biosynthesis